MDFIIATDNLSKDATADILKSYERQGCLHYIFEPSDDYSQNLWVSRMARMAHTDFGADWVLNVDADEFWWPNKGDLKSILERCPKDMDGLIVERVNFLTPQSYDKDRPALEQLTVCQRNSTNPMGRPLPPKACHRGFADIRVHQGNHNFTLPGHDTRTAKCDEATIYHFPVQDYESFKRNISNGGAAYERNQTLNKSVGSTWRRLYELLQKGELEQYYREHVFDESQLSALIEQGKAVRDTRLRDYMKTLNAGTGKRT